MVDHRVKRGYVAKLIFAFSLRVFLPLLVGHVSVGVGYGSMVVSAWPGFAYFCSLGVSISETMLGSARTRETQKRAAITYYLHYHVMRSE